MPEPHLGRGKQPMHHLCVHVQAFLSEASVQFVPMLWARSSSHWLYFQQLRKLWKSDTCYLALSYTLLDTNQEVVSWAISILLKKYF